MPTELSLSHSIVKAVTWPVHRRGCLEHAAHVRTYIQQWQMMVTDELQHEFTRNEQKMNVLVVLSNKRRQHGSFRCSYKRWIIDCISVSYANNRMGSLPAVAQCNLIDACYQFSIEFRAFTVAACCCKIMRVKHDVNENKFSPIRVELRSVLFAMFILVLVHCRLQLSYEFRFSIRFSLLSLDAPNTELILVIHEWVNYAIIACSFHPTIVANLLFPIWWGIRKLMTYSVRLCPCSKVNAIVSTDVGFGLSKMFFQLFPEIDVLLTYAAFDW